MKIKEILILVVIVVWGIAVTIGMLTGYFE